MRIAEYRNGVLRSATVDWQYHCEMQFQVETSGPVGVKRRVAYSHVWCPVLFRRRRNDRTQNAMAKRLALSAPKERKTVAHGASHGTIRRPTANQAPQGAEEGGGPRSIAPDGASGGLAGPHPMARAMGYDLPPLTRLRERPASEEQNRTSSRPSSSTGLSSPQA